MSVVDTELDALSRSLSASWTHFSTVVIAIVSDFPKAIDHIPWLQVTLGLSSFFYLWELFLDFRQSWKVKSTSLPERLHNYIDKRQYDKMQEWSLKRMAYLRLESTFGFILECLMLAYGFLPWLWGVSQAVTSRLPFHLGAITVFRGVFFIFLVSVTSSLVRAPFEMFRILLVDKRFDLSLAQKTLGAWLWDQFIMFAFSVSSPHSNSLLLCRTISAGVGIPVIAVCVWLMDTSLQYNWLVVAWIISFMSFFISELYPKVFAPAFNKFTPLPEGALLSQIKILAKSLNFPLGEVMVIDGSRRVAHSNAFVMGFLRHTKRIVLYDTILKQLSDMEILAILGHEIAHHKFNHIWKMLLLQLFCMGNFIFVFSYFIRSPHFYACFGFNNLEAAVGLVLFSYLYNGFSSMFLMLTNWFSRSFEYTCDEYAIRQNPTLELEKVALWSLYQ